MEYIIVYQSGKEVEVCNFEFMHTILVNAGYIKIKDGREYFYIDQRNG